MEDSVVYNEALRLSNERMRRQQKAVQAAIQGAPLPDTLTMLATLFTEETGGRTAFYLADEQTRQLHPMLGAGNMPAAYLQKVGAISVDDDSLPCGRCAQTGQPVITKDVLQEARWQRWTPIANEFLVRSCWAFPILSDGKILGTFAAYFPQPQEPSETTGMLAEMVTQTAALLVCQHLGEQARVRTEEALRQHENRLRSVIDAIPLLVWTSDAEGKANYFNHQWFAFTGFTLAQFVDQGWQAVIHPNDASATVEKWQQALQDGATFDTEFRLRRYDGVYRWFVGRGALQKDETGQVSGWTGSATDIEELKKTQEAYSLSEAKLLVAMESATDFAIITMDADRRIERWSSGASLLFGYTEEEVIGQLADLIFTDEDRAAGAPEQEMETAKNTGRAADERWHQRKDGSRFYMSGYMRPIDNGKLTGYVKVARDMTQQKLFTEELSRLVAERTRELQQSNESLQQFATIAAHDLQEPLRKLRLFAAVLQRYRQSLPEEGQDLLSKINATSNRMSQLISEVLQYSKITYGAELLTTVDLDQILQQVLTDLELPLAETGADILYETKLPKLQAIPLQMNQLFYNLLTNALKFWKEGRKPVIRISVRNLPPEEAAPYTSLPSQTDHLEIRFTDNGIGFEPQFSEQIFQLFERLHPVDEYEGTGVGLALCRKIVENHHGHIFARSNEGEGASFVVILPLNQTNVSFVSAKDL